MASSSTHEADKALDDVFESLQNMVAREKDIRDAAYAILLKARDDIHACSNILKKGIDVDHPIDVSSPPIEKNDEETDFSEIEPRMKKAKIPAKLEKTKKDREDVLIASCALMKWIVPYTLTLEKQLEFRDKYIRKGSKGLADFTFRATFLARLALKKVYPHEPTCVTEALKRMTKVGGHIFAFHGNMESCFTDLVKKKIVDEDYQFFFPPLTGTHRMEIIRGWCQELKASRKKGNVNFNHKLGEETIRQWKLNKHVRPSRAVYSSRQLTFIEDHQLNFVRRIGAGVEGTAELYTVSGISYIPEGVDVIVKTWTKIEEKKKLTEEEMKARDLKRRRASAVTEAILGGLDHYGIVGAFAMTTEDPPRLVYDYYNGGTINSMMRRIQSRRYHLGENVMKTIWNCSVVEISEMRSFMEGRLNIFHAILDTIDYVHKKSRCHNDLHMGNIFLHFEYNTGQRHDESEVIKTYVGVGDWGHALYLSEVKSSHRPAAIVGKKEIEQAREDYTQLAPELIGQKPTHYSLETDVYALGNILATLLCGKGKWEKGNLQYRTVCYGWKTEHQLKVEKLVASMCHENPLHRFGTRKWLEHLINNFGEVGVTRGSCEEFLRH